MGDGLISNLGLVVLDFLLPSSIIVVIKFSFLWMNIARVSEKWTRDQVTHRTTRTLVDDKTIARAKILTVYNKIADNKMEKINDTAILTILESPQILARSHEC